MPDEGSQSRNENVRAKLTKTATTMLHVTAKRSGSLPRRSMDEGGRAHAARDTPTRAARRTRDATARR